MLYKNASMINGLMKMNLKYTKSLLFMLIFTLFIGGFLHELGHLAVAQLLQIPLLSINMFSLTPTITVQFIDTTSSLLFLLGGQLFMPIFFLLYYISTKETSIGVWSLMMVSLFLGSSIDFFNILYILT